MLATTHSITAHPFLRAMVPEHRSVILQGAVEQTFEPGEIIFREGQPANRLYLLHEGRVALETPVPGKGDVLIAPVLQEQVLGWSWLVPPFVWHFQGRALERTLVTVLDGGHLLIASEQNHYLGHELMKGISKVILDVLVRAHERWLETGHHPHAPRPPVPRSPLPAAVPPRPEWPLEVRIAEQPFFHGISPQYLQALARIGQVKEFEPEQMLSCAGQPADGLYVIEKGHVLVESSPEGTPIPVQTVRAGEAVGWSSFCEPYAWRFDVHVPEPVTTLFFKAADLRERSAGDYHFGYDLTKRINRMMLRHLQSTRHRIWEAFH